MKRDSDLNQQDYVIVRIWLSEKMGGANVGHVSLETPKVYMSLWPGGRGSNKLITAIFENRPAHFMRKYSEDYEAEGRAPEQVVTLYSLYTERMERKFNQLYKKYRSWTVLGSQVLLNLRNSQSCSGLAYEVLLAGGITRMLYRKNDSFWGKSIIRLPEIMCTHIGENFYIPVVSPDDICRIVNCAKNNELSLYSHVISSWRQEEKSDSENENNEDDEKCICM